MECELFAMGLAGVATKCQEQHPQPHQMRTAASPPAADGDSVTICIEKGTNRWLKQVSHLQKWLISLMWAATVSREQPRRAEKLCRV